MFLFAALTVNAGGTYYLKVGEQKMLSFTPKSGVLFNSMAWRSYNTSAVRVDGPQYSSYTYVTALAPTTSLHGALVQCEYKYLWNGLAITATEDFYIKVEEDTPPQPTGISLRSSLSLYVGDKYTLYPTIYPSEAQTNLSWSSSNTSVAQVTSGGTVIANGIGSCYISVATSNGYEAVCYVTVTEPSVTVSISHSSGTIKMGTKVALKADPSSASIYYTIDGSTPSPKSMLYTDSIEINQNLTLKAIGMKSGYKNSEILIREFNCTSLSVVQVYPSGLNEFIRPSIVPTITFNDTILQIDPSEITIKRGGATIDGTILIYGKCISFIPKNEMLAGNYTFNVPGRSVLSPRLGYNMHISENFTINNDINVVKVSTGYYHTMAIKSDNTLWTWGGNFCGQLADGTVSRDNERSPMKVMENVIDAVGGYGHTLILKNDNSLWSVGRNEMGQLGRGYTSLTGPLGKVMSDVDAIATNGDCCYALKTNGSVYYWGSHDEYGYVKNKLSPTFLTSSAKSIAAGFGSFLLIIKEDGTLWGWNDNAKGQLGDTGQTAHYTPIKIIDDVIYCAAGNSTSYAIRSDNSLWAWGNNASGEIGDGTTISKKIPTKIMDDVRVVSSNGNTAFAVKYDGSLWQWGRGIVTPEKVMDNVRYAVPKYFAIKNDGTLYGWGDNSKGQIGVGSYDSEIKNPTLIFKDVNKVLPISVSMSDCEIEVESQSVLYPEIIPDNASYQNIQWKSSDEKVATIDEYGILTAHGIGETIVSATVTAPSGAILSAQCKVTVKAKAVIAESLQLSQETAKLSKSETLQLRAMVLPENTTNKSLHWSSTNGSVATVSENGLVAGISAGTAQIIVATTDGSNLSAICDVVVAETTSINDIIVDKDTYVKIYNRTGVLVYEGAYSEANLSRGMYIVMTKVGVTKRLIK